MAPGAQPGWDGPGATTAWGHQPGLAAADVVRHVITDLLDHAGADGPEEDITGAQQISLNMTGIAGGAPGVDLRAVGHGTVCTLRVRAG